MLKSKERSLQCHEHKAHDFLDTALSQRESQGRLGIPKQPPDEGSSESGQKIKAQTDPDMTTGDSFEMNW